MKKADLKNKIATDLEQSKKLLELGIDVGTADMHWESISDDDHRLGLFTVKETKESLERMQDTLKTTFNVKLSPAWSLSALLDILPLEVSFNKHTDGVDTYYYIASCDLRYCDVYSHRYINIVDAAFEMFVKLKERNLI